MILPVVVYGSPVLRKVAVDVTGDYPNLQGLIADMFETMYKAEGVGLAAPQVGKSIRLFIIDASPFEEDDPSVKDFKAVFINAKITEFIGEKESFNEGCLSLPGLREDVSRPTSIRIQWLDENFQAREEVFEGLKARIIQHEYDHIEGVLFVDKINPLRRKLINGKLNAITRGKAETSYKIKVLV